MHALDVLGDPVRRRIVELMADGPRSAGQLTAAVREEFGISQPAVSNHLRVLREAGFASARRQGSQRLYEVRPERLDEVQQWVQRYGRLWRQRLDALDTEITRGHRARGEDERGTSGT